MKYADFRILDAGDPAEALGRLFQGRVLSKLSDNKPVAVRASEGLFMYVVIDNETFSKLVRDGKNDEV
jgi:hypothetical protein